MKPKGNHRIHCHEGENLEVEVEILGTHAIQLRPKCENMDGFTA